MEPLKMKNDTERISLENVAISPAPLIRANEKKNFIAHGRHRKPPSLSRQLYMRQCPLSVIDKETLKLIQVLRLHESIDHTLSTTGSSVLLRSLIQPGMDLDYIRSKQESLREIASNDRLRNRDYPDRMMNLIWTYSRIP